MMLKRVLFVLAGAGLVAPAFAIGPGDKPVETIKRSEKWVVDYDRDGCHLFSVFGDGKAKVIARFSRYEPTDRFEFSLYGDRYKSSFANVSGKLDFGLGKAGHVDGFHGNAGTLEAMFLSGTRLDGWESKSRDEKAPDVTPEQEARVTGVTVDLEGWRPLHLEFGSLAKPMTLLRHCTETLVKSWGFDPEQQAAAQRRAKPANAPQNWLNPNDYPGGALAGGHNGVVQFRLDVDEEGKITGCYVLARTSPDDFADLTCRMVSRRGRFDPALDATGKPMRSYFVQKVSWKIR
ncbi:energy transducer TonB [Sphingomonas sp. R-74633]|uniref:energy transducer TonB n=1 Tax=Sphingomonas sp. R-74633 TaxID=2751188 RepID=UPI0015D3862D|nr:energy transducer TonB [Sphingomonas sp. R-74633]NYT42008.1 energy transducer TonB [Sphingomonas sp. R-74633]